MLRITYFHHHTAAEGLAARICGAGRFATSLTSVPGGLSFVPVDPVMGSPLGEAVVIPHENLVSVEAVGY